MEKNKSTTRIFFLKGFVSFALSSWVSAILSLFSTPIITRVFSTAEVGKINLFISIVNVFLNFSYLGIDHGFTRFYNEPLGKNDKKSHMGLCLTVMSVISVFVLASVLCLYKVLSNAILGYVTFIIPFSIILSIISHTIMRFFNMAARMEKNALLYNIQTITITIVGNVAYVLIALYKPSAEYAIVFRTALTCLAAILFYVFLAKRTVSYKCDKSRPVVKKLLAFCLPLCPSSVLVVANTSLGQLLMKHYIDYSAIGIYSNASTVASIITVIQSGINNYWEPYFYENYKVKQKQIIKMHHMVSFVMIMFGLGIILFQDLIYLLLIGKNFWASKQLFPLLVLSPICYTISETLGMGMRLSNKTYLNIPVYAINLVVNIGLCLILLPTIGVVGAAVAAAVSSFAMLIFKSFFGEKYYRCSDNYFKLGAALVTLAAVAVIHVFIYESPIKYAVYFIAIAIVCLIYIREVKTSVLVAFDLKNKFFKKHTPENQ